MGEHLQSYIGTSYMRLLEPTHACVQEKLRVMLFHGYCDPKQPDPSPG